MAQQDNFNSGGVQADGEFFASVGAGFRYVIDPNCDLRLDYGFPLASVRGDHNNENGRLHIGATLAY